MTLIRAIDILGASYPQLHEHTARYLMAPKDIPPRYRANDGNPPNIKGTREYEKVFDRTFERDTRPRSGRKGFR